MYLRHGWLDSSFSQVLGAMLFAWSVVIAGLLFAYWAYAAFQILAIQGDSLTDAELDLIHWSRRRRFLGRQLTSAKRVGPRWFLAL